jgi:hypothetical protein
LKRGSDGATRHLPIRLPQDPARAQAVTFSEDEYWYPIASRSQWSRLLIAGVRFLIYKEQTMRNRALQVVLANLNCLNPHPRGGPAS